MTYRQLVSDLLPYGRIRIRIRRIRTGWLHSPCPEQPLARASLPSLCSHLPVQLAEVQRRARQT